jgi:hypothetical protein
MVQMRSAHAQHGCQELKAKQTDADVVLTAVVGPGAGPRLAFHVQ